jgi:flagellar protein FliL
MERESSEQTQEPEAQPTPAGPQPLVLWAVVLATLLVGGAVGLFAAGPAAARLLGVEAHGPAAGEAGAGVGSERGRSKRGGPERESGEALPSYTIENLIVNPHGTRGTRFLMISLTLEADSPETAGALLARDAEVRDLLLRTLGSKAVEELAEVAAREALRAELLETTQALLRTGQIVRLHIPQYVIQ